MKFGVWTMRECNDIALMLMQEGVGGQRVDAQQGKCLLKCRTKGQCIINRGRYLRLREILKLQGIELANLKRCSKVNDKKPHRHGGQYTAQRL